MVSFDDFLCPPSLEHGAVKIPPAIASQKAVEAITAHGVVLRTQDAAKCAKTLCSAFLLQMGLGLIAVSVIRPGTDNCEGRLAGPRPDLGVVVKRLKYPVE